MDRHVTKRSWVEVSLGTLRRNYELYRASLPEKAEIMAVVKADAYGHGDREVARMLEENGVRFFAVSNIDEAERLRNAGITGKILILGYTPPEEAYRLSVLGITQALLSEEYAAALAAEVRKPEFAEKCAPLLCEFAIDTGMNRIGLDAENPRHSGEVIRKYREILGIDGIFTHLCVADTDTESAVAFTEKQLSLFNGVMDAVRDLHLPYCHCLNSAGGRTYSCAPYAFARLGIILYGLKPDRANVLPAGIKPAMTWKAVVSMVKDFHPGETVGYGRTFRAEKEMRIATIAAGYADGYPRALSNRFYVLLHGKRARIVGRICMDQMTVDVTDIPETAMGDAAVLLGEDSGETITADDVAKVTDTIGYEVICDIASRVPRVHVD
ncbi:alanine racemase [Clostridium vitabionis]|uniref:alanine racemase n=1 Tax=Clostridium vitabionis TaxID=2784388 RepID=UPI00188ACF39|nr:alanine racemase [Clostridium vitabionis]